MNTALVKVTVSRSKLIFGIMRSLLKVLMLKLIIIARRTVKRTVMDPLDVKRVGFANMRKR